MLVAFVVAVALVPLGGGRLAALAEVRMRRWWLLAVGLGLQVLALSGITANVGAALHGLSYVVGGVYLLSNLQLPGMLWVATGGALNLAGIAANGGTLPASRAALDLAGLTPDTGSHFANSGLVSGARLPFLGDIFAIPDWLPLANVFSVGDIVIACGIYIALHRLTGSRLVPPAVGMASALIRRPRARALWTAQCLAWGASWTFAAAVIVLTVGRPGALASTVTLGLCGCGAALLLGGPLVDRFNPPALLACCAFGQACAAGIMLIAPRPALLGAAAVSTGFLAGLARPAALVLLADAAGGAGRTIAAVGVLEATLVGVGLVMAGWPVADLLAAGARPVFGLAALLWGIAALAWSVMPATRRAAPSRATLWRDLLQAVRSVEDTPVLARIALLMAALGGGVGLAAADPFVALGLAWRRATPLGLSAGCLAVGAGLGALVATSLTRRKAGSLGPAMVVGGVGLFLGAAGSTAMWALAGWVLGGLGVGVASVVLVSLALSLSPEPLQGRVLSLGFASVLVGLGTGYTIGGSLAEAGGPVAAAAGAGVVMVAAGATAAAMARSGSVSESGIDQSDQLIPGGEPAQVLLEKSEEAPVRLAHYGVGDVRRDEAVLELPEGVVVGQRLWVGDVETGGGDLPVSEGGNEVIGDHVRAASDVHQIAAGSHDEHLGPTDHPPGLGSERQGDDNQIGTVEGLVEPLAPEGPCRTCQWLGISADDCCLHGEGVELFDQSGRDPAATEDGDPRAVEAAPY
ncbi:MAG TPA: DUF5317 family protein [Acidimicrobiales bacterium]|nr:DUF5317 family protein [Acidimicrobiales bacterium]